MKLSANHFVFITVSFFITLSFFSGGCAQIGTPSGGIKDTLAPRLVRASPPPGSKNVSGTRFVFEFDEYIDVQELANNLLVSPSQNRMPTVIANPRSITLKFRDSLLPNTTYNINFGKAIRDINENNVLNDFSYTFSTGNTLDSLELSGNVIIAETGVPDSLTLVFLYRNLDDSAVLKKKPDYIARVNGSGDFTFRNLPSATFNIYALKEKDGSKTYDGKTELFAFSNKPVNPAANTGAIQLLAYAAQKEEQSNLPKPAATINKKLLYNTNLRQAQDLLQPFEINFNNPLKEIDSSKIFFTDSNYTRISGVRYQIDSTAKKITLSTSWQPESYLRLIINKDAVKDSAGTALTKTDTIKFVTKTKEDYGRLTLRFDNLDQRLNPVIQFTAGEQVVLSFPLTGNVFINQMFPPGEYGVRILYDADKNGKWTTGNYLQKLQPETIVALPQKLTVLADWDNEREINL